MKRLIVISIVLCLCFGFMACQSEQKTVDGQDDAAPVADAKDVETKEKVVEPKIEELNAFTIVGMGVDCTMDDTSAIMPLWEEFEKRMEEIENAENMYGVSFGSATGFFYMACVEVSEPGAVPDGMESRDIPAAKYAVFPFEGTPMDMGKEYGKIMSEYIPAAKLAIDFTKPCLEYYPPDSYDKETGIMKADIYYPIQ